MPSRDKVRTMEHDSSQSRSMTPPWLYERVTALVNEKLDRRVWVRPGTFTEQIKVNRNTAVNTVAMGILPKGQRWRPLVSDSSNYPHFAVFPHFNANFLDSRQLKGAKTHHRKLLMWGELRVSSFGRASLDRDSLEFLSVSYFGRASLDKASLRFFGDSKFFTASVTVGFNVNMGIL